MKRLPTTSAKPTLHRIRKFFIRTVMQDVGLWHDRATQPMILETFHRNVSTLILGAIDK